MEGNLSNLIKALQIFLKYGDKQWPTHCEHDVLTVTVDPAVVSEEDKKELKKLGFKPEGETFYSYLYGSA
jgi:hypothetical protein